MIVLSDDPAFTKVVVKVLATLKLLVTTPVPAFKAFLAEIMTLSLDTIFPLVAQVSKGATRKAARKKRERKIEREREGNSKLANQSLFIFHSLSSFSFSLFIFSFFLVLFFF